AEGIPNQTLAYEECSRTTEENARFTATVLQPQGVKQILLITDSPHMLRSLLTFRSFGFTVIPYTSPVPANLASRTKALKVFSEYLALVGYGLQGRFRPQSLPEATNCQKSL
ncbi:MAG TPA: YdcF family protein, partial [Coleofasciculaceae cyanobacterium]